ncbi:DUF1206 domain-containing protein [Micromonospora sp. CPCC 205371]|nr:DUF1206 domain-containing protein [Micromonospora sp. CPCC 205371]
MMVWQMVASSAALGRGPQRGCGPAPRADAPQLTGRSWPTMAATYRPDKKVGLDAALTTLAAQAYGTALLILVATGLACFGVYCPFDARYRRG